MKINWDIKNPAKGVKMGRFHRVWRSLFGHKPVPLCESDHYIADHFRKN